VSFPLPVPGLVIRYSYLWQSEHEQGREEGLKERPCAIVLTAAAKAGGDIDVVLPVTHSPPDKPDLAIEIPSQIKKRLGLDDQRSWIMLTEANRFVWPGPDVRPARRGDANSIVYGPLPYTFFELVRQRFVNALRERRALTVPRTPA
jgi:hypothetical protein